MEIEIKNKTENKLLNRTEVLARVSHDGKSTPSRKDILQIVSKEVGKQPDVGVVLDIKTSYGENVSSVKVYFYETREDMERIEREYLLKKSALPVSEKEEEPKEEKKEEPKEEKKEEPKEEKKEEVRGEDE